MAIVFHSKEYQNIQVDSHMIIGVMGNYQSFFKSMDKENIYYLDKKLVNSKQTVANVINESLIKDKLLKDLDLEESFLNKKISNLSHNEMRLFRYLKMLTVDENIIVIDEPFLDLDTIYKKRVIAIFNQLVKSKTIIVGSSNSDVIYSLCKKVLLLGKNKYLYDDVSILGNKSVLKRFNLTMPEIIEFIRLANDKKIKLPYVKDIRDLIKDVYKHVSK